MHKGDDECSSIDSSSDTTVGRVRCRFRFATGASRVVRGRVGDSSVAQASSVGGAQEQPGRALRAVRGSGRDSGRDLGSWSDISDSECDDSTVSSYPRAPKGIEQEASEPRRDRQRGRGVVRGAATSGRSFGKRQRSRMFCFTINNWSEPEEEVVRNLVGAHGAKYCVYQHEAGEAGTPHIQGFVVFLNPRDFAGVRSLFSAGSGTCRAHVEACRGDWTSNYVYCTKESSRMPGPGHGPWEFGERPAGQGRRSDIQAAAETARDSGDIHQVIDRHPVEYVKYHKGLGLLSAYYCKPRSERPQVRWYYGPPGSGKSFAAFREGSATVCEETSVPGSGVPVRDSVLTRPYYKPPGEKWWDHYMGQSCVIIDDYRPEMCGFGELLAILDRYPMLVPRKGDFVQLCCKHVWITTPLSPQDTWISANENVAQLLGRIDVIKAFSERGVDGVIIDNPEFVKRNHN